MAPSNPWKKRQKLCFCRLLEVMEWWGVSPAWRLCVSFESKRSHSPEGLITLSSLSALFCLGLVQPAVLWFLQAHDFASVHTETLVKRHHSLYREAAAGTAVWSWERVCKHSRQQPYLCYICFLASLLILLSEIVHVLMLMEVHGMGRRAMPITGPVVM